MSITYISEKKAINTAFFKLPVLESEIQKLSKNLEIYINSAKNGESEEYHKGLIKDFFANTWYAPDYSVNTNGREDLVIFNGNDTTSKPTVIIEAKSPTNTTEMFSEKNQNCKALQECVYYFLQENLKFGNNEIKHIIITNYEDFYIFDAKDFSRFFLAKTNPIVDKFYKFEAKGLMDNTTAFFYENCAKTAIEKWIEQENICVTRVTPKAFYRQGAESLIPLYKIFSPEHLLAKPFANDSNSLDRNFYAELLHIIGLEEVKDGGKKLIQRKSAENRDSASLIESAIYQLEEEISSEEKCFEIALHLVITWVNRLLFLKLVESQQVVYQKGNADYKFLTEKLIPDFDDLNILFFKVLGRKIEARDSEVKEKFRFVPYLNSSLFEISEEEREYLQIRGIKNKPIKLYSKTVLKDEKGKRLTGTLDNLAYIFRFLDAYNFSSDSAGGITQNSKTLINASVLGLIFEKINGYKDGSFFTPGFITEYMAKETVERAVIQKFNDVNGWKCKNLDELKERIENRTEANEIFNSIRICDPAVGSGHFLVSVLNRLLFIKSYLNILMDKNGKRIKRGDWELCLENDEISILDEDGNPFVYTTNSERQRVQEAIFAEKRTLIENCLFGVDINPASVYICRLRLWIELLKNTYYTEESGYTQLETLPNIDINIKCGNSLVSKYVVQVGSSVMEQVENDESKSLEFKKLVNEYKKAVLQYKNESNKEAKHAVDEAIKKVKSRIRSVIQLDLFDEELNEKAQKEDIFRNSLEWMFEFPEVLDDDGRFIGFDAVIGNPPYISAPTQIADKKIREQREAIIESQAYKSLYQKWDIYIPFIELGLKLSHDNSIVSMIAPFPLTNQAYAKLMRKMLVEENDMFELVDLNGTKIFDEATVSNCIPFIKKAEAQEKTWISKIDENLKISRVFEQSKSDLVQDEKNYVWNLTQEKRETNRHENMHVLGDYCYISKGMVLNSDENSKDEKFVKSDLISETQDKIHCKEYIEAKNIDKYSINKIRYLEYGTKRVPAKLSRPTFPELYNRPKLLTNKIGEMKVILDYNNIMCDQTNRILILWKDINGVENKSISSSIKKFSTMSRVDMEKLSDSVDLRYLLGIMNSKYASVLLDTIRGTGNIDVNPEYIRNIPIPSAIPEQQKSIIDLVDEILAAKKANHTADTTALESEIDRLVYALYGLSEDEIKVVEGR